MPLQDLVPRERRRGEEFSSGRAIAAGLIPWEKPCRFVVKGASTHDLSKARSDPRISSRTELVSAASNGLGACVRNHSSLLQEETGLERLLLPSFMTK
jgi:hypothetical protein